MECGESGQIICIKKLYLVKFLSSVRKNCRSQVTLEVAVKEHSKVDACCHQTARKNMMMMMMMV